MKSYYTQKAWERVSVNEMDRVFEIEFQSGVTLFVTSDEYSDVSFILNECEWYANGHVYQGDSRSVLECVTIYKTVDYSVGA